MGRHQVRSKSRPAVNQANVNDYCLTLEEVRRSARRWSYLWRKNPDSDSEADSSSPAVPLTLKDPSAYGDWHLLNAKFDFEKSVKEMVLHLNKFPYPELFHSPLPLGARLHKTVRLSCRPHVTNIFEDAMPEIRARARKYMDPPAECEGAVGYDSRFFQTSMLIKFPCRRPYFTPIRRSWGGESWMDGLCCAKLSADFTSEPRHKKPPSRPIKLLKGLRRKSVFQGSTRWFRPRTEILLNSESKDFYQTSEDEEEQQISGDYFVELANDETKIPCHSSSTEDSEQKISRTQSDITLDSLRTRISFKRCHSLGSIDFIAKS
ncbi:uncharacterized protein LOC108138468 [Drosophila elegans]|uniref:uncharacterized protein LOC108138468 n=1 Tax=Drosophila elegans TaxID=30023 RepID=UPI0007E775D0|nr:uncharacterized protein LOC108138468 [Drosophila elegans]